MISESCSKATLRCCIFSQIENGDFSRPVTSTSAPRPRRRPAELAPHLLDHVRALAAQIVQASLDGGVGSGSSSLNDRFCSSVLTLVHADAAGQRRVDVHGLARDALPALLLLDVMQRAHVVQAVGQLHDQHADVAAHCQHQLAEVLRLLGAVRLQLEPCQLGDAVDQAGHCRAEPRLQLRQLQAGVLDRIVQQPGDDAGDVQRNPARMPATASGWVI